MFWAKTLIVIITKTKNEGLVFIFTRAFHFLKIFSVGIFVKIFYLATSTRYIMREISNHCKKDGGKIMIIMIITAIASLVTLDYIDTKEAEKSAKLYEIIECKEDNDEN